MEDRIVSASFVIDLFRDSSELFVRVCFSIFDSCFVFLTPQDAELNRIDKEEADLLAPHFPDYYKAIKTREDAGEHHELRYAETRLTSDEETS